MDQCHFIPAPDTEQQDIVPNKVMDEHNLPVKKSDRFGKVFRKISGRSHRGAHSSMDASMDSQSSLNTADHPLKSALHKIFRGV